MSTIEVRPAVDLIIGGEPLALGMEDAVEVARDIIATLGIDMLFSDPVVRDETIAQLNQLAHDQGPWSATQRSKLFAMWRETFPNDKDVRAARLQFAEQVLGHEVNSWTELSFEDASRILDALNVSRAIIKVAQDRMNAVLASIPAPGPSRAEQRVLDAAADWQDAYAEGFTRGGSYRVGGAGARARTSLDWAVRDLRLGVKA